MKRSMSVSLLLMGTAALTGCGQKEETVQIYKDVDACIAGEVFSAAECRSQFAAAETEREQNAPAYETAANCERDYGVNKCQPTTQPAIRQARVTLIPLLAGYIVGSASRTLNAKALYRPNGSNDFRTATGRSLANGTVLGKPTHAAKKRDDDTQSSSSSGGGGGGSWRSSSEQSTRSASAVERGGWGFRGFHISG